MKQALEAIVGARQMSPTSRKVVAKRQAERLLQDEVSAEELETVRREIDEAPDVDPLFGRMSEPSEEEGRAEDGLHGEDQGA